MPEIDYNKRMWQVYARGRVLTADAKEVWMSLVTEHTPARRPLTVVDVGSGVGRFSPLLAEHFGGPVLGIEPASKMREVAARTNSHVCVFYVGATAERLPVRQTVVDLAFVFLAYQHFGDQSAAIHELARVLRPGGSVFLRSEFCDLPQDGIWHQFLPRAGVADHDLYPSYEETVLVFEAAGLRIVFSDRVRFQVAERVRDYIDRLVLRPFSVLEEVSDEEMDGAARRMRRELADRLDEPLFELGRVLIGRKD